MLVVFFGRIERFQRNDFGDDGSLKASAAVEFKNFFYRGAFREGIPFLDSLLEKLHLQDLDGADLMLLLLLFFLFEEKADDELLIALGLLLIL